MPLVSVIMASRNCPQYIAQAVRSMQEQTLRDIEIIVVDESTDTLTRKILHALARKDPRVKVHEASGLGISGSFNVALRHANGKFLARMDADDVSMPDRLARQVAFLDEHPEIGVVGSWARMIDVEGKEMGLITFPPRTDAGCRKLLIKRQPFIHPTIVVRREVMEEYNSQYRYAEDYELLSRLARKTKFANIPEPLLKYRNDPQQASIRAAKQTEWNSMKVRFRLVRTGAVPFWNAIHLVRPLAMLLVPTRVKRFLLRR